MKNLKNKTDKWQHVFKRLVKPGGMIPISELSKKQKERLLEIDEDIWEITTIE